MRVVDVLLAFPGILLNLAIVAIVPTAGVGVFVFALWPSTAGSATRASRAARCSQVREREFVTPRAPSAPRRGASCCATWCPTSCRR